MKSLLNPASVELLVSRVQNLAPDKQPLWGQMNATEMLVHCNSVNGYLLTPTQEKQKKRTSLKQYILRWIVLYVLRDYPKNAKAPKQLRTKGKVLSANFEEEKQTFIRLLKAFPELEQNINHSHPFFGNLSTKQWGVAMWKHTDHHLRQFGV